jgi:hypothetical protein
MWEPGDDLVDLQKLLEKFSNSFWRFASSSPRSALPHPQPRTTAIGEYLVQTGPAFCQRVSERSRLPRFDPAGTALSGRHSSFMGSPEDCGAGGLTSCLPLPLSLDGLILLPVQLVSRPAGPTGWTRGYATAARLGAEARGYFGCLRSFPEVRKTVVRVSCTY